VTTAELIAALQAYPQDAVVVVSSYVNDWPDEVPVVAVRESKANSIDDGPCLVLE
jgi:hypothetical protein